MISNFIEMGKIENFEDLVVHSDKLDNDVINNLAIKHSGTIKKFEEIIYLQSYLHKETLQKLCADNMDKVDKNTDIKTLFGEISDKLYLNLLNKIKSN